MKLPVAACFTCAACLALLVLLALGVEAGRHADVRLFAHVSENPRAEGGGLADALASLADPLPITAMLVFACVIAVLGRRPSDALAVLLVVIGANLTTELLKFALAHPRLKTAIGADPFEPSTFPSGHTTAAASIAIAYAFAVPDRLRGLAAATGTAFALAVGASVVVIGWHYPSDVLGGLLVASAWGFAVLALMRVLALRGRPRAGFRFRDPLPSR